MQHPVPIPAKSGLRRSRGGSPMTVIKHSQTPVLHLAGIEHQTLAGPKHGLTTLEVWLETIAPGAATPVHTHDCEEVFVILSGSGHLSVAGREEDFGPDSTLIVRPNEVHQISNTGPGALRLIVVLGMSPVRAATPEGQAIPLPWEDA